MSNDLRVVKKFIIKNIKQFFKETNNNKQTEIVLF